MRKEECELIAQATTSIARMTIHYCDYVEELMAGFSAQRRKPPNDSVWD